MSYRPGTQIVRTTTPPIRSAPTDTGVWFVAGLTDRGKLEATLIQSLQQFVNVFGARQAYSVLYDAIETFFHEGGSRVYVSRVVGPSATVSTATLNDAAGTPQPTLRVEANGPGAWGNSLNIAVLAGDTTGNFKLQVSDDVLGILETSPDLVDKAAALAWAQSSSYINLVDLGTSVNDPAVVAATSLTGGADDRGSITDTQWQQALDRFDKDLGPGQVSAPGRTTTAGQQQLIQHSVDHNRVAILDAPDTATVATLISTAASVRGNGQYAALFAPWLQVPGLSSGTVRLVPPSAGVAGRIAVVDSSDNPNVPAAGTRGQLQFATGLSQPGWTDAQRDQLNSAGVDVIREIFGGVRIYGWRTTVDAVVNPNFVNFANSRLTMGITSELDGILEEFLFDEIDGRGALLSDLKGALNGALLAWFQLGALYGNTPDAAFYVDTGDQVNTPETIANHELHAVVSLRMSEFAEFIELRLIKRSISEAVV